MKFAKNIKLQTKLNDPSPEALAMPFYSLLPKDEAGLIRARIAILKKCLVDEDFRSDCWRMCCEDVCFFAAVFCWLHETRDDAFTREAGKFPFVPWCDQIDLLAWLQLHGGRVDVTIEKTRGIGLSWVIVIFLMWKWLTCEGGHLDFGILSKDNNSLDVAGRPSTLMGKLDLLFENLPGWMQIGPDGKSILHRTSSTDHKFINKINKNAILGFTASDDKLRSARLNLIIIDEAAFLPVDVQRWLASSQFVSSSRIFVSTHDGSATMFYRMTINEHKKLVRISTWWQANPARYAGCYVVRNGKVEILDKDYDFPIDYPFCYENPGLERSPWVDGEFDKPGADHMSLMQEIYGVAALDTKKLFSADVMTIAENHIRPPNRICRLTSHDEFVEDLDGEWRFWQDTAMPFTGVYYIGVDPAVGVADRALAGIVAIDAMTGETIATAGLADCNAARLANAVVVLAKLLCGPRSAGYAQIAPEVTGIGAAFMSQLRRLRWPNIFREGNGSSKIGIHNRDKGEKILIEAGRAIKDGDLIVSDRIIIDDFDHFEYNSKVELVFTGDIGHGDVGQAAALAWWAARDRRRIIKEAKDPVAAIETEFLIQQEPLFQKRKSRKKAWAQRFALTPPY